MRILLLMPPDPCGMTILQLSLDGALPRIDGVLKMAIAERDEIPDPNDMSAVLDLAAMAALHAFGRHRLERVGRPSELVVPLPAEQAPRAGTRAVGWLRPVFPLHAIGWTEEDCRAYLAGTTAERSS